MHFIYSWTVKTRPCSRTSWRPVPWNSKSSAGNSTWGNRLPPWKGHRVWISPQSEHGRGWQTDWVSATFQWSQPSTLPSAHTPATHTNHTHTHHHLFTLFSNIHFTLKKYFPKAVVQILCTHTICISLFFLLPLLYHCNLVVHSVWTLTHSLYSRSLLNTGVDGNYKRSVTWQGLVLNSWVLCNVLSVCFTRWQIPALQQ